MGTVIMETNKFKRFWIWFWYNDYTRFGILLGLPTLMLVFLCGYFFGTGEYLRIIAGTSYVVFFGWGMIDNDYTNLYRIGRNLDGKKIKQKHVDK